WLFASQHLAAGGRIAAMLDTTPRANRWRALPHLPDFLASPYARKGLRLVKTVRRQVPVFGKVTALRAVGEGRLEAVLYRRGRARSQRAGALDARPPLPRRALPAGSAVPHPRGRHDRVPMRGGDGAPGARGGRPRRHRAEPAQGLPALRHGAVPGPAVRPHG